jgi:hypothetical protein
MLNMFERRSSVRHKSFMQGRVYFNHRQSCLDCIVRDFTTTGARLEFSEVPGLPDTFELFIPTWDEYHQARTVWHNSFVVGVAWVAEGAVDAPGDGDASGASLRERVAKLEHIVMAMRKRIDAMEG